MRDVVLTLNAGSSSVKFAIIDASLEEPAAIAGGQVESLAQEPRLKAKVAGEHGSDAIALPHSSATHREAIEAIFDWIGRHMVSVNVAAVGHRVVHGGAHHSASSLITDALVRELRELVSLAPLHQPHNLAGIEAARDAFPAVPQVACFDTAFHRGHDFVTDAFAIPRHFYEKGVRRYGFHGLSYEFVVSRLQRIAPDIAGGRVIVAHLGNGASLCGISNGRSIASTMGFTALDGLAMGTRCGQIDPGVLLYLMSQKGMDCAALTDLLYHKSGLIGLSGVSADMRELEASDRAEAREAIAYFVMRVCRETASLVAALEGIDAIVFTGGIGENSRMVRASVLQRLGWLGVEFDAKANDAGAQIVSAAGSRVRALVIPTDEELMIARHTAKIVGVEGTARAA